MTCWKKVVFIATFNENAFTETFVTGFITPCPSLSLCIAGNLGCTELYDETALFTWRDKEIPRVKAPPALEEYRRPPSELAIHDSLFKAAATKARGYQTLCNSITAYYLVASRLELGYPLQSRGYPNKIARSQKSPVKVGSLYLKQSNDS